MGASDGLSAVSLPSVSRQASVSFMPPHVLDSGNNPFTSLLRIGTVSARSLPAHCWPIIPGLLHSWDLCFSVLVLCLLMNHHGSYKFWGYN